MIKLFWVFILFLQEFFLHIYHLVQGVEIIDNLIRFLPRIRSQNKY